MRFKRILILMTVVACLTGCAQDAKWLIYNTEGGVRTPATEAAPPPDDKPPASLMETGRLYVCRGQVRLGVGDPQSASWKLRDLTKAHGGYVEAFGTGQLVLRVPAADFEALLADIERVGTVLDRQIEVVDVTDSHGDMEAEFTNLLALRGRLQALLVRAKTVEETLKIEQELARVQTRIDQLNARKQRMGQEITYAKLAVDLVQRTADPMTGAPTLRAAWWLKRIGLKALMN